MEGEGGGEEGCTQLDATRSRTAHVQNALRIESIVNNKLHRKVRPTKRGFFLDPSIGVISVIDSMSG